MRVWIHFSSSVRSLFCTRVVHVLHTLFIFPSVRRTVLWEAPWKVLLLAFTLHPRLERAQRVGQDVMRVHAKVGLCGPSRPVCDSSSPWPHTPSCFLIEVRFTNRKKMDATPRFKVGFHGISHTVPFATIIFHVHLRRFFLRACIFDRTVAEHGDPTLPV